VFFLTEDWTRVKLTEPAMGPEAAALAPFASARSTAESRGVVTKTASSEESVCCINIQLPQTE
jgi:hypothetical protein